MVKCLWKYLKEEEKKNIVRMILWLRKRKPIKIIFFLFFSFFKFLVDRIEISFWILI